MHAFKFGEFRISKHIEQFCTTGNQLVDPAALVTLNRMVVLLEDDVVRLEKEVEHLHNGLERQFINCTRCSTRHHPKAGCPAKGECKE